MLDQVEIDKVPSLTRTRSNVIRNPASEITDRRRLGDHWLYSPMTRGSSSWFYEPVPRLGKAHRQEPIYKKNPLLPATSFVPRSVLLSEQPAVNIAENNVGQPQLYDPYPPESDTPAPTVANSLTESRDYRQQRRTVDSLLDTRAQARRMVSRNMTRVEPDRPQIVDIKRHREKTQSAFQEVAERQRRELIEKIIDRPMIRPKKAARRRGQRAGVPS